MSKRGSAFVPFLIVLLTLFVVACSKDYGAPAYSGGIPDELPPTRAVAPAGTESPTPVNALNILDNGAGSDGELFAEPAESGLTGDSYPDADLVASAQPDCPEEETRVRRWAPGVSLDLVQAVCVLAPIPDSDYLLAQEFANCAAEHSILWEISDWGTAYGGASLAGTDPRDFRVMMLVGLDDARRELKADFVAALCRPGPPAAHVSIVSEWSACLEADARLADRVRALLSVELDENDARRDILRAAGVSDLRSVALFRYETLSPVLESHLLDCPKSRSSGNQG